MPKIPFRRGVITRNNSATTSKSARKQNFEECWAYSSWIQNQKSRTRPESIRRCSKGGIHKRLAYKVKYRYLIDLAKWNAEWSRSHGFPLPTFYMVSLPASKLEYHFLLKITSPIMSRGIMDIFSICPNPVEAKFFNYSISGWFRYRMHYMIGLQISVGE